MLFHSIGTMDNQNKHVQTCPDMPRCQKLEVKLSLWESHRASKRNRNCLHSEREENGRKFISWQYSKDGLATIKSLKADVSPLSERWRRANARNVSLETLNGGQFTFSTQLIILNYPVILFHRRSTMVSSETYPLYSKLDYRVVIYRLRGRPSSNTATSLLAVFSRRKVKRRSATTLCYVLETKVVKYTVRGG